MKIGIYILILAVLISNYQMASGAENEYGIVRAWFNGKNATVENIQLKIGEPSELKIEVTSKINGNVYIKIFEPGMTKAFDVINGPTKQDEGIDNLNIISGWTRTLTWTIAPNGAWKNGNAPINIFVEFSKIKNDKKIQFTIANPYILDERYSGTVSTPKPASSSTETVPSTPVKGAPFTSTIFALSVLLLARQLMN
ncbi:MAG: sarcinarray family MAST domain-containing protein [Candidatus Methanoperedens sp.]|nr:sarcinarray family MAST domain-containing protein [Candidatus Methanoperedens sp.]